MSASRSLPQVATTVALISRALHMRIGAKFFPRHFTTTALNSSSSSSSLAPYAFLDCGGYRKLERFGEVICSRSCPTAYWKAGLSSSVWKQAMVSYTGSSGNAGEWSGAAPSQWNIHYQDDLNLTFKLDLSDLGQVGIFPEQFINWKWLNGLLLGGGRCSCRYECAR